MWSTISSGMSLIRMSWRRWRIVPRRTTPPMCEPGWSMSKSWSCLVILRYWRCFEKYKWRWRFVTWFLEFSENRKKREVEEALKAKEFCSPSKRIGYRNLWSFSLEQASPRCMVYICEQAGNLMFSSSRGDVFCPSGYLALYFVCTRFTQCLCFSFGLILFCLGLL